MKRNALICSAVLAASMALAGAHQTPSSGAQLTATQKRELLLRTEKSLQKAFLGYPTPVVVDIDIEKCQPNAEYRLVAQKGLFEDLTATQFQREAVHVSTGMAFVRNYMAVASSIGSNASLLRWLTHVDKSELEKLAKSALPFTELSPVSQQFVLKHSDLRGLQEKIAKGEFVSVAVRMQFRANFVDRNGKHRSVSLDPGARFSDLEQACREKARTIYEAKATKPPPSAPSEDTPPKIDGSLDFSQGRLLTMSEAIKEAAHVFKKPYTCDGRLASSLYYWQGRFTEATFLEFQRRVQQPVDPELQVASTEQIKRALNTFLKDQLAGLLDPKGAPGGLSFLDALNGTQFTALELNAKNPDWAGDFTANHIDPNCTVTLSAALGVDIFGDGSYDDHTGQSPVENSIRFVFDP